MPVNISSIANDVEAISRISAVPNILEVICRTTGMGFAAVARVTDTKWVACAVRDEISFGLHPGGELELQTTICDEIRQSGQAVIIDHVANDPDFACHHTPLQYGFQSYISMPIVLKDGSLFGTLCAIDPQPHQLNNKETISMFNLFAELIAFHLNASDELEAAQQKLQEERQIAELREQFIAILGHDLRNPVGAVANVAQLMLRMPLDDRLTRLAHIIQDSSFRMKGLIENILDFARGRMGEGIILSRNADEPLQSILEQVITELRLVWPDREIITNYNLTCPINADGRRVAQLFSNLLGNALTHSKKETPVKVQASTNGGIFELQVINYCKKIPAVVMERLFHPFSRGEVKPGQQGLGLGLYIASEIAKAHGGTLTVTSTVEETTFVFRMPV